VFTPETIVATIFFILSPILASLFQSHAERHMAHVSNQIRTAMMTAIYHKVWKSHFSAVSR